MTEEKSGLAEFVKKYPSFSLGVCIAALRRDRPKAPYSEILEDAKQQVQQMRACGS